MDDQGGWAARINAWTRNHPAVILLVLATLLISSAFTIYAGIDAGADWYGSTFRWRQGEYEKLRGLRAGTSIDAVKDELGVPLFVRESKDGNLVEATFQGRDYWVQAVHDQIGTVKLLAVTSCDYDFRPTFDTLGGEVHVNVDTFSDISPDAPSSPLYLLAGATGNSSFFDTYGGGNPGFYKLYYVGINDACPTVANHAVALAQRGVLLGTLDMAPENVSEFRQLSVINTYAETDIFADTDYLLSQFQIGVDRILIRTVEPGEYGGICEIRGSPCGTAPPPPTSAN